MEFKFGFFESKFLEIGLIDGVLGPELCQSLYDFCGVSLLRVLILEFCESLFCFYDGFIYGLVLKSENGHP